MSDLQRFIDLINRTPGNSGITDKNTTFGPPAPGYNAALPSSNTVTSVTVKGKTIQVYHIRLDVDGLILSGDSLMVSPAVQGTVTAEDIRAALAARGMIEEKIPTVDALQGLPKAIAAGGSGVVVIDPSNRMFVGTIPFTVTGV